MEIFAIAGGGRPPLIFPFRSPPIISSRRLHFPLVAAARGSGGDGGKEKGPELDTWDEMELKFGRLIGEDPKLTLAKIMARKLNRHVSYLDVEESVAKDKSKLDEIMKQFPGISTDLISRSPKGNRSLTLTRPVMGKVVKGKSQGVDSFLVETEPDQLQNASTSKKSNPEVALRKPSLLQGGGDELASESNQLAGTSKKRSTKVAMGKPSPFRRVNDEFRSNQDELLSASKISSTMVALRKPSILQSNDDDLASNQHQVESTSTSKMVRRKRLKPKVSSEMQKSSDGNVNNVTLLKKPELLGVLSNQSEQTVSGASVPSVSGNDGNGAGMATNQTDDLFNREEIGGEAQSSNTITHNELENSEIITGTTAQNHGLEESSVTYSNFTPGLAELVAYPNVGLQLTEQRFVEKTDNPAKPVDKMPMNSSGNISWQTFIRGEPQRVDSSLGESNSLEETLSDSGGNMVFSKQEDAYEDDWRRVERYVRTGERVEVELIDCSAKGFVVTFGSVIGFVPYRYLGTKWKFLAFESWLRKNGVDPSLYRQNLGVLSSFDFEDKNVESESGRVSKVVSQDEGSLKSNMKFEDLLQAYDQEKTKFLFSFIGQKMRVSVELADRNSNKIIFSGKRKENEELAQKKRRLMARLNAGDVVKCCIKKFVYFGIFVEVEGVPALIHHYQVPWDANLDPLSSFKIGQIVEARVHELDFPSERIFLSLKDVKPDPSMGTLDSIVGGTPGGAQADNEWADVDALIEELQKIEGVSSVSKGRFFLTPGLAPTFQVYMASVFDSKCKLLARDGNKVQEVMVQASLDKEEMKAAILACTQRVS